MDSTAERQPSRATICVRPSTPRQPSTTTTEAAAAAAAITTHLAREVEHDELGGVEPGLGVAAALAQVGVVVEL